MANIINSTEIKFRVDNSIHKLYKPKDNQSFWDMVQQRYQFSKTYDMDYCPITKMVTLTNKPKKVIKIDRLSTKAE